MTAQPTTTTVLFSERNVEALMILGKAPRFEIRAPGREVEIIPATRSWKREQKLAVARAEALVAGLAHPIDTALAAGPVAIQTAGVTATRKAVVLRVYVNGDESRRVTFRGGHDSVAHADASQQVAAFLLGRGLNVIVGDGELVISEPKPGDDCYEDYIALQA